MSHRIWKFRSKSKNSLCTVNLPCIESQGELIGCRNQNEIG